MSPLHGYRVRAESDEPENISSGASGGVWRYGPCLYLGPRGQRCERPALEDGFCAVHSLDAATTAGTWVWFRRLAAVLLTAAILWPIVEALLEELSHWRH